MFVVHKNYVISTDGGSYWIVSSKLINFEESLLFVHIFTNKSPKFLTVKLVYNYRRQVTKHLPENKKKGKLEIFAQSIIKY